MSTLIVPKPLWSPFDWQFHTKRSIRLLTNAVRWSTFCAANCFLYFLLLLGIFCWNLCPHFTKCYSNIAPPASEMSTSITMAMGLMVLLRVILTAFKIGNCGVIKERNGKKVEKIANQENSALILRGIFTALEAFLLVSLGMMNHGSEMLKLVLSIAFLMGYNVVFAAADHYLINYKLRPLQVHLELHGKNPFVKRQSA